jgi:hypothetical protein
MMALLNLEILATHLTFDSGGHVRLSSVVVSKAVPVFERQRNKKRQPRLLAVDFTPSFWP